MKKKIDFFLDKTIKLNFEDELLTCPFVSPSGSLQYCVLVISKKKNVDTEYPNEINVFDVFLFDMNFNFKLADDYYILTKSQKDFFSSSSSTYLVAQERGFNDSDLNLSNFANFGNNLGFKIKMIDYNESNQIQKITQN